MKEVVCIMTTFLMTCCIPQSDYDSLKTENRELREKLMALQNELSTVKLENDRLLTENRTAELARTQKRYYTEEQALSYIKDYYDFYHKTQYKNVRIRRTSSNSFIVSVEECADEHRCGSRYAWHSTLRELVIENDGTYKYVLSLNQNRTK